MRSLLEFNPYHDKATGRFTTANGGSAAGDAAGTPKRRKPVQVASVDEAIGLLLKGQAVELPDPKQANTLLTRLAEMANDAKAKGADAPNYDLCNVSVAGSNNLFCGSKLRTKEYPDGVPRIDMPQFSGTPVPGSKADALPKNDKGEVNAADAFMDHLRSLGIPVVKSLVPAARLRASQAELVGPKVAGMMTSKSYDPAGEPIFISRDHYVIDGHHRWAAVVGRDAQDGRLGDLRMQTVKVDAPISEVLLIAREWATQFGIAGKGGPSATKARPSKFLRRG